MDDGEVESNFSNAISTKQPDHLKYKSIKLCYKVYKYTASYCEKCNEVIAVSTLC